VEDTSFYPIFEWIKKILPFFLSIAVFKPGFGLFH